MALLYTALLAFCLLFSAAAGWAVRRRLHERHTTVDALDSIRVLMGMLLTFSALVLGLLTSNAKQRFDGFNDNLSAFATNLIELDHRLRVYGSGADDIHRLLRTYTAAAIADSWPGEPAPSGDYPRTARTAAPTSIESERLGDMLSAVDIGIGRLTPRNDFEAQMSARLRDRITQAIEQRWKLIFSSRPTISWPFLVVLTTWLSIIFAIFGMTSPRSRLVYAVVFLSALSIASPLYLIIQYSRAFTGLDRISSEPMRAALAHMDRLPSHD